MLFILTGEIQTGKTRWLERLVARLRAGGIEVCGVLAPGVWVEHADVSGEASESEKGRISKYEKLGIDNRLLPQDETISFARRRDLAQAEGLYDEGSESARAALGWEMYPGAIERVNEHFCMLRSKVDADAVSADASRGSFLIVDELGPLELLRGGGLVSAVEMLDAGPTDVFPHALVIVRESLVDVALERFGQMWACASVVTPGDVCEREICSLLGVA